MSVPERKICWRITRRCNMACLHCLAGNKNFTRSDLPRSKCLLAAKIIAQVGLDRITWTGGEPTLSPDLPDLLLIMQGAKIYSTITTNGLSLFDSLFGVLDIDMTCLRFSFEGLRDTHNRIRNANVFDRTVGELIRMRNLGFRIEANITAMNLNLNDIPELTQFLADQGVDGILVTALLQRESAIENQLIAPSQEQFKGLTEAVFEALQPFPSVDLCINDYSKTNDPYIILESDGDIIVSSELALDKSYGLIISDSGAQRLESALSEQTLSYRSDLKKAMRS